MKVSEQRKGAWEKYAEWARRALKTLSGLFVRHLLALLVGTLLGSLIGAFLGSLLLYAKLGKENWQRSDLEYYINRMSLPANLKVMKTFTGDLQGLKTDSSVFLVSGKSDYFFEQEQPDPENKSSRIIIFDEKMPGFWEMLIPQVSRFKKPTFQFLPLVEKYGKTTIDKDSLLKAASLSVTDELLVADLDNNNMKEIVSIWVDGVGASFTVNHAMIIYWDGGYKIRGMPPIRWPDVTRSSERRDMKRENLTLKNKFDKRSYIIPTFTSDDTVYFEDVNDDGHIELVRALMLWYEGEVHADAHALLVEAFAWRDNDWHALRLKATYEPYFIIPKNKNRGKGKDDLRKIIKQEYGPELSDVHEF